MSYWITPIAFVLLGIALLWQKRMRSGESASTGFRDIAADPIAWGAGAVVTVGVFVLALLNGGAVDGILSAVVTVVTSLVVGGLVAAIIVSIRRGMHSRS
nr:hypothetical protein [Rhodococcus sp. (in: high G+C Gram-positive bacteria)]